MLISKEELADYWVRSGLVKDERVIQAFLDVPRELFVLDKFLSLAYEDQALPIIESQTISQPSTVVMMLDWLEVCERCKVLEIGAGSGYNAALISRLTNRVVISVERIESLVEFARKNLEKAGVVNVEVVHGDGYKGYKKYAPYDRIICTCAVNEISDKWVEQLKEDGILVAPVGKIHQDMVVGKKVGGKLKVEKKGMFRFVPLVRDN